VRRIAVTNAAQFKFERLHVEAQVLANELKLGHMDSEYERNICFSMLVPSFSSATTSASQPQL
jgi:hypothetical protein